MIRKHGISGATRLPPDARELTDGGRVRAPARVDDFRRERPALVAAAPLSAARAAGETARLADPAT